MNEQSILCFLSIAETHNFSATARSLMITQQAVSRAIQKLESELGFALLIRDQNMVILTQAGEHFLRFLKETNRMLQDLGLKSANAPDTLRIGISDWLGNAAWLKCASAVFYDKYPEKSLLFYELPTKKAKEMLSHQQIDCYLTTNYEMEHMHLSGITIPIADCRLCLASAVGGSARLHLCSNAGESDDICIQAREIRIYQELSLPLLPFKIYPDNSSVFLNTSFGNGVCFIPECGKTAELPHFVLQKLEKNVELVFFVLSPEHADPVTIFTKYVKECIL